MVSCTTSVPLTEIPWFWLKPFCVKIVNIVHGEECCFIGLQDSWIRSGEKQRDKLLYVLLQNPICRDCGEWREWRLKWLKRLKLHVIFSHYLEYFQLTGHTLLKYTDEVTEAVYTASSECLRSVTNIRGIFKESAGHAILWPWVIYNKVSTALYTFFCVFKTLECQLGVIKVSESIGLVILILKQP